MSRLRELTYETAAQRFPRKAKGYRAKQTAKKRRAATKGVGEIRAYVFARERNVCRCCRKRRAESMHEIRFRSLGGKVSKANSIAVCGDGVRGCHGLLQRHEIGYREVFTARGLGAESTLEFPVNTRAAAEWLGIAIGQHIESPVMAETEIAS